jgi:hypothetical protein
MRRSALGSDQGPTEEEQAGGPGVPFIRRGRFNAQDPTNVSFPFLHMMRKDHMVGMGLHFIKMDALSAPWWYDGDDARVQAYADKLIRPIYGDLFLIWARSLEFGYSPGSRNFQTARPNWKYFEDGVAKKVWDNGEVDAIVYKNVEPIEPETAQIVFDKQGRYDGIQYDARYGTASSFIIDGLRRPNIDKLHSFWGVHDKIGEGGSPYGFPRIAYCAPIFWMYRWIWDLIARGYENSFDPGPVVRFPDDDPLSLTDAGERERPVDRALRMGQRRRTGSTLALSSSTYKDIQERASSIYKWGIEYPKMETDFTSVLEFIGYLEAAKLNGLFMPEQSLTEGRGSSSSRNVAENFSDQRSSSQNNMLSSFHRWVDDVFTAPVIAMVFPWYEGELELKSIGAGSAANDLLRQVFQLAGQENYRRFGIDLRRLAEANGFPMLDPEEQQRELEKQQEDAAKIANATPTPEVKPTQGRRSLVTQTGFGETVYHQIGSKIELSRDGDFVASLPRTDAFSDAVVVANARELRAAIERLASWAYGDFALAVSKRRDMLSDDASETVRRWVPDTAKAEGHAQAIRRALEKLYQRTTDQAMKQAGSQNRILLRDELLDTRAIEGVGDVLLAARQRLSVVVEGIIEKGLDVRAAGGEVRDASNNDVMGLSSTLAKTIAQRTFNEALLLAGDEAGVKHALIVDECHADRHGTIVMLQDIVLERAPVSCGMTVRLLPRAPQGLEVRREELEDGSGALYDEETETILVSPRAKREDEAAYMVALAHKFR